MISIEGYKLNKDGTGCIADCKDKCVHGSCVAPNKCKCEHGYGGPTCDISSYYKFIFNFLSVFIYMKNTFVKAFNVDIFLFFAITFAFFNLL